MGARLGNLKVEGRLTEHEGQVALNRERDEESMNRERGLGRRRFVSRERDGDEAGGVTLRNMGIKGRLGQRLQLGLSPTLSHIHCRGCGHDTGVHSMPIGCKECSCRLFILRDILSWVKENTRWIALDSRMGAQGELEFRAHHGYYLLMLSGTLGRTMEARVFLPDEFDFTAYRKVIKEGLSTEEKQPEPIVDSIYRPDGTEWPDDGQRLDALDAGNDSVNR